MNKPRAIIEFDVKPDQEDSEQILRNLDLANRAWWAGLIISKIGSGWAAITKDSVQYYTNTDQLESEIELRLKDKQWKKSFK